MRDEILKCIYSALEEANRERGDGPSLPLSPDTELHGSSSALDSLGLINFLVAVEEGIEKELGVTITLSDDRTLSTEPSPLQSVGTLVNYVETLLREQRSDPSGHSQVLPR